LKPKRKVLSVGNKKFYANKKSFFKKKEVKKSPTYYKSVEAVEQCNNSTESTKPVQHQNILNKKKLKTKTDVILKKYLDK
ncbi:MAG: hypothetical protein U9R39_08575, partial [Campylobacterota bacterium]|nr:hypothetical protein [Campylobacterota bacterium]